MDKIFDSELKVLEVLWKHGETSASEVARLLHEQVGWSKTTTYTVIKKCIGKSLIERGTAKFICRALVSKDDVRTRETTALVNKMFDGCSDLLVANLLSSGKISSEQLNKLRQQILEVEP